jgi:hypothetical protein
MIVLGFLMLDAFSATQCSIHSGKSAIYLPGHRDKSEFPHRTRKLSVQTLVVLKPDTEPPRSDSTLVSSDLAPHHHPTCAGSTCAGSRDKKPLPPSCPPLRHSSSPLLHPLPNPSTALVRSGGDSLAGTPRLLGEGAGIESRVCTVAVSLCSILLVWTDLLDLVRGCT